MSQPRVPALILSMAGLCGCVAGAENEPREPVDCTVASRASVDWGARAAPPSGGWIELHGSAIASGEAGVLPAELASDCTAAISCNVGLVAESYRFDPVRHTIDFMLKHYGDATLPLAQSAHVSYVLEDGESGDLPFTTAGSIAPGSTLHAGGQVGTSTHVERVWARVRF